MAINIPDLNLRLLAELCNAQRAGLNAAQLGSILTISGTSSAAASSGAQHALYRLRHLGFAAVEAMKPVKSYRITPAGLRALARQG